MAAIDVKPLALTHAVATCVCFLNVMPHFGDLTQVPVNARQARVRRRKIWIELDGALVERRGAELAASRAYVLAGAERLQGLE